MFIKLDALPKEYDIPTCPECGSQKIEIRIDTTQKELHIFCYPCLHLYLHADYVPRVDKLKRE